MIFGQVDERKGNLLKQTIWRCDELHQIICSRLSSKGEEKGRLTGESKAKRIERVHLDFGSFSRRSVFNPVLLPRLSVSFKLVNGERSEKSQGGTMSKAKRSETKRSGNSNQSVENDRKSRRKRYTELSLRVLRASQLSSALPQT